MTNYEKIRRMSQEEMSDFLFEIGGRFEIEEGLEFCVQAKPEKRKRCLYLLQKGLYVPESMCKRCLTDWLNREADTERQVKK